MGFEMLALAVGGNREHSQDVLLRPVGKVAQNLGIGIPNVRQATVRAASLRCFKARTCL